MAEEEMTARMKIEIADWLKIITMAVTLLSYGIILRKDVDAHSEQLGRVEQKLDAILVGMVDIAVLKSKHADIERRLIMVEERIK
jgi:hypothetical protein